MKNIFKIILLGLFFVFSSFQKAKAQGNLQFNQVKLFETTSGSSIPFSVPAGKVWKIESAGGSVSSCYIAIQNSSAVNLGYLFSNGTPGNEVDMPLWLPSSYSGFFITSNCAGSKGIISVIEFNVVP